MTEVIFRHFRPHAYDKKTHQLCPLVNGGVSFGVVHSGDYWLYICPESIPFSTKQAVKSLRETIQRKVEPWGRIPLDKSPLLDQLIKSVLAEDSELPVSKVAQQVLDIKLYNSYAQHLEQKAEIEKANSRIFYEEN